MAIFKRKLYRRGSSFETTIPIAMLFQLDLERKHKVVFNYDNKLKKWFIDFEVIDESTNRNIKKTSKKIQKRGKK